MLTDAPTTVLPPVPAAPDRAPVPVPRAWLALCVRVTLGLWLATLGVWTWALVLAGRALWGAG